MSPRSTGAVSSSGAGSRPEIGDAQLALSAALARRVQAEYALASARARLLAALG